MAKIRKRGSTYQIDYFDPTGKRVRQSFKTKKEAEGELAARVSLIRGNPKKYLEISKTSTSTFDELVKKYRENYKSQRSYESSKKFHIEKIEEEFKGRLLESIKYYDLESYRTRLRNTINKYGRLRKDSTVNRLMACLRHMFAKAVEWEMLDRSPFERGRSLQLKENNKRLRFLTEDEIENLLNACPEPLQPKLKRKDNGAFQGTQATHLKDFVTIAIHTGMRKGEILSLKWSQIKNDFIYLSKTKTDEARQIPIDEDLEDCLKGIRKRNQFKSEYIFPDDKKGHLKDVKTAFKSALDRAGIEDFRPHDLRHTFASHFLMRGGTLKALKEILGHADIKMTMRYAHLSKEFAKEEIQLMNGLTSKTKKAVDANSTALNSTCHKTVTK